MIKGLVIWFVMCWGNGLGGKVVRGEGVIIVRIVMVAIIIMIGKEIIIITTTITMIMTTIAISNKTAII